MKSIEDKVYQYILDRAPNAVIEDALISDLSKEDEEAEIKSAIERMKSAGKLTDDNIQADFADLKKELPRKSLYLKDYPKGFPVRKETVIGERVIPRLLDNDKIRAEDVNRPLEALAEYANRLNEESKNAVKEGSRTILSQMIAVFGIFVSIFSVIVISTDKLIRLDPNTLSSVSKPELFLRAAIVMSPAVIVIVIFLLLLVLIKKL